MPEDLPIPEDAQMPDIQIPEDIRIKARFIKEIAERLSSGKIEASAAQTYLLIIESIVESIKAALTKVININDAKSIGRPEKKDEISIPIQSTCDTSTEESDDLNLPNPATRNLEGLTPVEIEITRVTPYVLLNINLISDLLNKANIYIPLNELNRMESTLELADFSSTPALIDIITHETESERPPLVMITPLKILLEGQVVRMTTETLLQVTKSLQKKELWHGHFSIDINAYKELKNQSLYLRGESELRMYSVNALKGSKELARKAPIKQVEHQDTAFDDYRLARNYKVDLSLAWALLLWELQENDHPQIQPFTIRLNNQNRKPPIYLDYRPGRITISCPEKAQRPICGMGASCIIPVKIEEGEIK